MLRFRRHSPTSVEKAYSDLFSLHGKETWKLDIDALIQYFRSTDDTSAIVGRRQATTFQALSALSGHAEAPSVRGIPGKKSQLGKVSRKESAKGGQTAATATTREKPTAGASTGTLGGRSRDVGLTVRVEINLPADGDQDTYDRIFKSIRENLIDAE